MAQKTIAQSTPPKKEVKLPLPQINLNTTKPPEPTPQPTPKPQLQQQQQKTIPEETLILTDGLEALEGILYAMRQRILQHYGPIDYQAQKLPDNPSKMELHFTEEQAKTLFFHDEGIYWIITPKQFLGSEGFAKITGVVRALGGEYVAANKQAGIQGHWRIRK